MATIKSGDELMQLAEKSLATSFFKRKPDWDTASDCFEKAAIAFKNAQDYEKAITAFLKAAEAHSILDSMYMAAKATESAAMMAQKLNKAERSEALYIDASKLFLANGSGDRAADMFEKAAKSIESINSARCVQHYVSACDLYEEQDKARIAVDTYKRAVSVMLKNNLWLEAISMCQRILNIYSSSKNQSMLNKICLSIIILLCKYNDEIEAGKQFSRFIENFNFGGTEEGEIANQLLEAFENRDQELCEKAMKRPTINYLDNEVARVAKALCVPGGGAIPSLPPQDQGFDKQPQASQQHQMAFDDELDLT